MKLKKLLASVVTMTLLFTCLTQAVNVQAEDWPSVGDGLTATYDESTGTLLISGTGTLDKGGFHEIVKKVLDRQKSLTITLDGTGVISLPEDSSYLFGSMVTRQTLREVTINDATINLPDNLDTSKVTNMHGMFTYAEKTDPNVSNWDTSKVTDMSDMFLCARVANPDVSNWDTSKVTDMSGMFAYDRSANPDVSKWNTSNVTNMQNMFCWTSANPNVSKWDTSKVTTMAFMFNGAEKADPDVSNWDTSNVTSMLYMFNDARSANPDVSKWNTSKVTTMEGMFAGATSANPDVYKWNMSNVKKVYLMLKAAPSAADAISFIKSKWPNIPDIEYIDTEHPTTQVGADMPPTNENLDNTTSSDTVPSTLTENKETQATTTNKDREDAGVQTADSNTKNGVVGKTGEVAAVSSFGQLAFLAAATVWIVRMRKTRNNK